MSFMKTGMLKTARVEVLDIPKESWSEIRKLAKVLPVETEEKPTKEAVDKEAEFQVIATIDPAKFIYIHSTIMAGVKSEENGHWITAETEKFINDNHDAWTCDDLLNDYKSFKRATTFVEHDQRLENARGKCVDVIARDMGDTVLIDVLFSVDRRHKDLVANIENGIINAVSMGCTTAQTVCSICGNIASDPNAYCAHLKPGNKGRQFDCSDGKKRRSAEICKNNTFFDVSLVANPAFAGAIFRKILSSSEVSNHLLANLLNSRIEAAYQDNCMMLKAASKDSDVTNISIKQNGTIEIMTPTTTFTASETLSQDELDKISSFLIKKSENKQPSMLDRVLSSLFGKKALHPILNESEKKDFRISDSDYSENLGCGSISRNNAHNLATVGVKSIHDQVSQPVLELNQPHNIILQIIPTASKEQVSRLEEFECLKCGFVSELWKVKAASIDSGKKNLIECPRCFFAVESSFFVSAAKRKFKIKDKVKILSKKDKNKQGEIVAVRGPLYIVKLDDKKTVWKNESELEKITKKKSNLFVASKNIPVENDEGTYWFDEQGNTVITKGEKVSFVTTVEGGEYGLFTTETGEDFFMPMSHVNSSSIEDWEKAK